MTPKLHPEIAHLEFLLGTWRGSGQGEYPTIDDFSYNEEVTIGHVGKPFLSYQQKTKDATSGLPLHAEAGYFRPEGLSRIELVVVQPSGITEVDEGTVEGQTLTVDSTQVALSSTAKEVTQVRRVIEVDGDEMTYRLDMAAVGQEMQFHLRAALKRA